MEIPKRLAELKAEQTKGSEQLFIVTQREADLRATLQRIAGAIAILEELAGISRAAEAEDQAGDDDD